MQFDEARFYGMGSTESLISCFWCLKTLGCKCAIPDTKANDQHTKDTLGQRVGTIEELRIFHM